MESMDAAATTPPTICTSFPNNRRPKQKLLCRSCSFTAVPRRQLLRWLWLLLMSLTMVAATVSLSSFAATASLSSWSAAMSKQHPTSSSVEETKPSPLKFKTSMSSSNASLPNPSDYLEILGTPYHDWELFSLDFSEMVKKLKIFVYSDVSMNHSSLFAPIFVPHPDPFQRKLGNYLSEHMFKIALLRSPLLTSRPKEALFFFMPFSINSLRNHPLVHSEASIADFVTQYTTRISRDFDYWNASRGSDHFFVCCHSVGRNAASNHYDLHNNAIQVACSSSYFQRLYVAHKDVALPQVWPRPPEMALSRGDARRRTRLVFFAGRIKNSRVRQELINTWENDTYMDIFSETPPFPYEEGFRRSKYCLHVKGYEVNTARISDAIHYGCIPVIISNHYELPFANILNWSTFSIVISHEDIAFLKEILTSISEQVYLSMYENLRRVRRHFKWHTTPRGYDAFYMSVYQLWLRRGIHNLP